MELIASKQINRGFYMEKATLAAAAYLLKTMLESFHAYP